jgi:23S rRNA (guanosine2251-2'-O)-methyltransferase
VKMIYGVSPVIEALRSGRRPIERILLAAGAQPTRLREVVELARQRQIPCLQRDRRELDERAGRANHQGVIALLQTERKGSVGRGGESGGYVSPEVILDSLGECPLLVLLDGIEDPQNLGAILRTCEGAGVEGIFLPAHRAAGLTETVAKTSAGAIEHLRIAQVPNLVPLIATLQERGIWVIAVEGGSSTPYTQFDLRGPLAIVMGSEGKGVRRLVRERCDAAISIPMHGSLTSLNVSVAAGVILFETRRQRLELPRTAPVSL